MAFEVKSIDQWLIGHGQHPGEAINGETLHDLLWCFWVHIQDERREQEEYQATAKYRNCNKL